MDNNEKDQSKNKEKEDQDLWEFVTRDVTPLDNKPTKSHTKEVRVAAKKPPPQKHNKTPCPPVNAQTQALPRSNETDRNTAKKLKRGQIAIDARIDLHGLSQSKAYASLKTFIKNAYALNMKCVLVITGKGTPRHGNTPLADQKFGVLKTQVPRWLDESEFGTYILKYEWAKQKDGGEGALYVLMRKKK